MWVIIVTVIILILIILKVYVILKKTWCRSKVSLIGKTVIVTGANTGIGLQTALNMAMRGAKVILACRNMEAAEKACKEIIEQTDNPQIYAKYIDMSKLSTVREFAKDILKSEQRLDILVNNAGAAGLKHKISEDGLELVMQINYFGPFLLTVLLADLLKKSAPSRIVNVSSLAAKVAKIHFDNLNGLVQFAAYKQSKLCNIYFTKELSERLEHFGVTSYSLHPGAVQTDIFRHLQGISRSVLLFFYKNYFKTAEEGAQTIIYTAVEKGIEKYTGEHFEECQRIPPYNSAKNIGVQKKLWSITEDLVKLDPCERLKP